MFFCLADLEQRMRATLGALASFNEDERMLLLRCASSKAATSSIVMRSYGEQHMPMNKQSQLR
jgi:hypothetical protein